MLRYVTAALALKAFSCGKPMKKLYRMFGNMVGGKLREGSPMPGYYLERIRRKVNFCRKHDILKDGDCILELGTGWIHWEAITLRLFWDIEAVLYDVWDNRQFSALKSFLQQLDTAIENGFTVEGEDMPKARRIVQAMLKTSSFEELYQTMGFRYVLDPSGLIKLPEARTFRLVVSAGVFEHIYRDVLPEFNARWAELIAPGGFAMHSINIRDHLTHYDPKVSQKQYLAYSKRVWSRYFENDVQYINLVQRCEWLEMFAKVDLVLCEEICEDIDLGNLKVNERFANFDLRDLRCGQLHALLQKKKTS